MVFQRISKLLATITLCAVVGSCFTAQAAKNVRFQDPVVQLAEQSEQKTPIIKKDVSWKAIAALFGIIGGGALFFHFLKKWKPEWFGSFQGQIAKLKRQVKEEEKRAVSSDVSSAEKRDIQKRIGALRKEITSLEIQEADRKQRAQSRKEAAETKRRDACGIEKCMICQEDLKLADKNSVTTSCGCNVHYHRDCAAQYQGHVGKCPMCRRAVSLK